MNAQQVADLEWTRDDFLADQHAAEARCDWSEAMEAAAAAAACQEQAAALRAMDESLAVLYAAVSGDDADPAADGRNYSDEHAADDGDALAA